MYDQLATITGRLVVTHGPRIATLPKRYRNAIVSRYPGGKIYMLDFRSLEPRIILASAGITADLDIYDGVCRDVPGISRAQAKSLTIAMLYGAGEETLSQVSGLGGEELFSVTKSLVDYFGLNDLRDRLNVEASTTNKITNRYGRPIFAGSDSERKLVNYYAQSTAVDCALLGFGQGIKLIHESKWKIVPIYVIHDALMIDVHPQFVSYIEQVGNACSQVPGYDQPFPIKYEELNG